MTQIDVELQLYNDKYPCVHCGYCCSVVPCQHGVWNADQTKCQFLTSDNKCVIYNQIKGDLSIGFGMGCSSPLCNELRDQKLKAMKNQMNTMNIMKQLQRQVDKYKAAHQDREIANITYDDIQKIAILDIKDEDYPIILELEGD